MNNEITIKNLEALRDDFYKKYKSIDDTINLLKGGVNGNSQIQKPDSSILKMSTDGYDKSWSMKIKLSHILKKESKFLHIRQIAEILNKYEPDVSVKDFISKLYPAIAVLKKSGTIVKYSVDSTNNNTFWGSKNWLDSNGIIKEGYMYDKDQVKNNIADVIEI